MNIGIDVDGVLTNLEEYQLKYGRKYFKDIPEDKIDETKIDIQEIFGCTKEEREKFWTKYIWQYCLKEPPKKNASLILNRLKDDGHKIYIITSRAHATEDNFVGEIFRKMLYHWLEKEQIPYENITLCSEKDSEVDKLEACKKYKIDVMIDDKSENVMTLSTITKVLCFDAKYNQECSGENITRVYDYNQIYDEINKIYNKNYFTKLSPEELKEKSTDEKIEYFKQLKNYYLNLPYNSTEKEEQEKNYIKLSKIATPIFNAVFSPKVFNRELVPNENGLLFVANHNNYYDQFPIIAALGDNRPIHFLTATKMLKLKRGYFYLKTGAISVDREDKNDRHSSSEEIKKILINGGNVFIFPEGRTNRKEAFLLDFQPGAVAIAQEVGCKIVPIAVNDNYKKEQGDLCVRFGNYITIDPNDDVIEKTEELKNIIAELKQQNIEYVQTNNKIKELKK